VKKVVSLTYIWNCEGPTINPWGTPHVASKNEDLVCDSDALNPGVHVGSKKF